MELSKNKEKNIVKFENWLSDVISESFDSDEDLDYAIKHYEKEGQLLADILKDHKRSHNATLELLEKVYGEGAKKE